MPPNIDDPIVEPIEWTRHMDNLANLMTKLGNNSRDNKLSQEMISGMLDEKGPVVLQLDKFLKTREVDAPVPQYLPVVDPWYRYLEYETAIRKNYKGQHLFDNIHPTTERELAVFKKNNRFVEKGIYMRNTVTRPTAAMLTWSKRFDCSAFWCDMSMSLLHIDGKAAPGETIIPTTNAEEKKEDAVTPSTSKDRPKMNSAEVQAIAKQKSDSLRDNIVVAALSPRPLGIPEKDQSGIENLLSHTSKNKYATPLLCDHDVPMSPTRSKQSIVAPPPVAKSAALPVNANISLQQQQQLGESLDGLVDGPTKELMNELHLKAIACERQVCEARLKVAQAEVARAEAEEAVARAKTASAQMQVRALNDLLEAYKCAESKLVTN